MKAFVTVRTVELYADSSGFEVHAVDPSGMTIDNFLPFSFGCRERDVFGMLEHRERIECQRISAV